MKKTIAIILALLMAVSVSMSALGAVTISFEDQNTYGKANAASKYYRKCKIEASTEQVKFGQYAGKISTKPYFWSGDDDVAEGYVEEFYVRLSIRKMEINDGDFVDMWFYLPEDSNIDLVNIKAYDINEDEVLAIDTFTNDEEGVWTSLSEYWGGSLDNQSNDDINSAAYLCFYGKVLDPEKEACFYVDNIFIGNESELEKYTADPNAFVTVSADVTAEPTGDSAGNTADAGTADVDAPTKAPADEGQSGSVSTDTIIIWSAVAVAVVFAIVAAIVIAKKKK